MTDPTEVDVTVQVDCNSLITYAFRGIPDSGPVIR